jgi:hypothetical protein
MRDAQESLLVALQMVPYGPWSKVVHYIGDKVVMHTYSVHTAVCGAPDLLGSANSNIDLW